MKTFNFLQNIAIALGIVGYIGGGITLLMGLSSEYGQEPNNQQVITGIAALISALIVHFSLLSIGEIGKQLVYLNQKMSEEDEPEEKEEEDRKEEI